MPEMKSSSLFRKLALTFVCLGVAAIIAWQYQEYRHVSKIPLTILKGTGFLTFKARVNGKDILMAVDTAANTTVFSLELVDQLQLESSGRSPPPDKAVWGRPSYVLPVWRSVITNDRDDPHRN